jgi:hypothetical protein
MKKAEQKKALDHSGSSFTDFLEEEGIREEAEAIALKRVIVWQLQQAMKERGKTKQALAKEIKTRADFLLLCPTRFCEERLFLAEKPRERPWVLGTPIGNPL